jgi:hypothetical protein
MHFQYINITYVVYVQPITGVAIGETARQQCDKNQHCGKFHLKT